MMRSLRRSNRGYLLVELLLVLAIVGIIIPSYLYYRAQDQIVEDSNGVGVMLAQYTSGVRAFMSGEGDDMLTAAGCVAGVLCPQVGANWLKNSTDCPAATGAVTEPYLPCAFPDRILGRVITTHLFRDGDQNFAVIRVGTFTDSEGVLRVDLASAAASAANSTNAGFAISTVSGGGPTYPALNPLAGAFFNYYAYEAGGAWAYDPVTEAPAPADGELVAEANSAPSLDAWLRTDGSNPMQGTLDMNNNDIDNVATLTANEIITNSFTVNGDITADDVILNNVNGGTRVSTFWSGATPFTGFGPGGTSSIPKPTCTGPASTPDGTFIPLKVVYYPNDDAGTPGAQIGDISAQTARLVTQTAVDWRVEVDVASINAPDPATPVALSSTNSEVAGIVMTRCI